MPSREMGYPMCPEQTLANWRTRQDSKAVTSAFGAIYTAHPNSAIGQGMVRYPSEIAGFFNNPGLRSYPKPRCDFRPRAYVVLTREIGASRSERHG
ncbi:hypothetical protein BQ8482_110195 [Mesorhizobium delmotii]|uniref:Uncharacterized protein n=1 Tax=Mesorhizobium delmotii TaxID=1631247 RepID=A0A2P9AAV0_9HYPH|nr:hypothetical protein BQ8482_110195 [Mesorhizobium delmotii]